MDEIINQQFLQDRCYPIRIAQPSCIRMPASNGNNFELNAHYIGMLSKFSGERDAYLVVRELEEVYVMIKLQQLSDDIIKLRFISFALKDG